MASVKEIKIMKVGSKEFINLQNAGLRNAGSSHHKTFKVKKDEQVNKVYFVHIDEEENLHFIGRHSDNIGFIDKAALMREISTDKDINSQLIKLIDQESNYIPSLNIYNVLFGSIAFLILFLSFSSVLIFPLPALAVLVATYPFLAIGAVLGILLLGTAGFMAQTGLTKLYNTINTGSVSTKILIALGSAAFGAMPGAALSTLIFPGIGTLIGALIGAFVSLSICTVILAIDYSRKKTVDNPGVIGHLKDLPINKSIGELLLASQRKFVNDVDYINTNKKYSYATHVETYKALFSSEPKLKEEILEEELSKGSSPLLS
jgi:hypothetical protein